MNPDPANIKIYFLPAGFNMEAKKKRASRAAASEVEKKPRVISAQQGSRDSLFHN